jgi:hypothetical protein
MLHTHLKLKLQGKGAVKGKVRHRAHHEGPEEEQGYNNTFSFTSALDGGGWPTTPWPLYL